MRLAIVWSDQVVVSKKYLAQLNDNLDAWATKHEQEEQRKMLEEMAKHDGHVETLPVA